MRSEFQEKSSLAPAQAVTKAASTDGLVVLSDTGDSVLGGAGGDSTVLLREMVDSGVRGAWSRLWILSLQLSLLVTRRVIK